MAMAEVQTPALLSRRRPRKRVVPQAALESSGVRETECHVKKIVAKNYNYGIPSWDYMSICHHFFYFFCNLIGPGRQIKHCPDDDGVS